ncbi:unnamed protein product (mitochondrion) [Plasmodiophora brassicae]|uniref:CUE domain-containing protein n=1 Tax=Plasmodiophora brassicae TaxID=37360 RepID=A0A3P3YLS9_PLABS|nr:unnamed protein product [Plasmodiophora brassicae]
MASAHDELARCQRVQQALCDMFPAVDVSVIRDHIAQHGPDIGVITDALLGRIDDGSPTDNADGVAEHKDVETNAVDVDTGPDHAERTSAVLIDMFPDFDANRLCRISECVNGDLEQAVEFALEVSQDDYASCTEDVLLLSSMFPLHPLVVLREALNERDGSIDATIADLIADYADADAIQLSKLSMAGHLKLQALKRLFPGADEGTIRLTLQVKDFKWDATRAALAEVFPIVLQPEARPPARVSTSDVHPEDSEGPRMFPSATSALLDKMYEGIEIKFDVSADERAIGTLVTQRDNIRHRARDSYHKGSSRIDSCWRLSSRIILSCPL